MKTKHFLLTIATGIVVFSLALISNTDKEPQLYKSRASLNSEKGEEINGAIEWLNQRRNNLVTGTVDIRDVVRAQEQVAALRNQGNRAINLVWEELGPNNFGGRTRAILIDKDNNDLMFAGGVSGGLWKSTTAGLSWVPVNNFFENLAVVSICQAANGDIYFGTGEGMYYNSGAGTGGIRGKGIWKSTTHGESFTWLETSTWGDDSLQDIFKNVNKMAADPENANRIYAATSKGLMVTDNGGTSWFNPIYITPTSDINLTSPASDVKVCSDGTVIAAVENKCYVSPNGNDHSFVKHSGAGSNQITTGTSRLEFAIAPSDDNYIYCQASCGGGTKIYLSTDKGENWSIIAEGENGSSFNPLGDQGDYDNVIAVFPNDKNKILVGGQLHIWKGYNNAGQWGWEQVAAGSLGELHPLYVHVDHHAIVFHPTDPNILFIGTDGGIFRSTNGALTFQSMNKNYNVMQCYSVTATPTGEVACGAQDNGSHYINYITGNSPMNSVKIGTGDGGYVAASVLDPRLIYCTSQYGYVMRYLVDEYTDFIWSAGGESGDAAFVTPVALWESFNDLQSTDSVLFINESDSTLYYGEPFFATSLIHDRPILEYLEIDSLVPYSDSTAYSVKVQDPHQAVFAVGYNDNIRFTRDGLEFGAMLWTDIVEDEDSLDIGTVSTMEFSKDGDHLYFACGGTIYRASNFLAARKYSYPSIDTVPYTQTDSTDIISIDTTYMDSLLVDVDIEINGFNIDTTYDIDTTMLTDSTMVIDTTMIVDTTVVPPDTTYVIDTTYNVDTTYNYDTTATYIDTTYLVDTIYIYEYTEWDIDTVFGIDSLINYNSITVNVNHLDTIEITKIGSWSTQTITSIAVDPNNAENVVVTLGNYGNPYHVYYSSNAASTTSPAGNFSERQGNLPEMPVYSSVINWNESNSVVIVGTEYGVYATEDITATEPVWTDQNQNGLAHVPVFMIRQQTFPNGYTDYPNILTNTGVENHGVIYIGTHGRGMFKSLTYATDYDNVDDPDISQKPAGSVKVYPNPAHDITNIAYELAENSDVNIVIYDLSGRIVKSVILPNRQKGILEYTFSAADLRTGTYIINLTAGNNRASSKFVVY